MSFARKFHEYRQSLLATGGFVPKTGSGRNKEIKIFQDFLAKSQAPAWLTGVSAMQREAANQLYVAIRDDTQQSSTHRIRECVRRMGLPKLTKKNAAILLKMCRGNDLAFLWFAMEIFHKPNNTIWTDRTSYNTYEQIIMTLIAYLDMPATISELDRLLPPGHIALKTIQKQEEAAKKISEKYLQKLQHEKNMKNENVNDKSPYLRKLKTRPDYGKPLRINRPTYKIDFDKFALQKPMIFSSNINTRWYADYQLCPARRVIVNMFKELISNIVGKNRPPFSAESFCRHHKQELEDQEFEEHKRRAEKLEDCLRNRKLLGLEKRKQILLKDLEASVKTYMLGNLQGPRDINNVLKFQADQLTVCNTVEENSKSNCPKYDHDVVVVNKIKDIDNVTQKKGNFIYLLSSKQTNGNNTTKCNNISKNEAKEIISSKVSANEMNKGVSCEEESYPKYFKATSANQPAKNVIGGANYEEENFPKYFKATTANQPYMFDYEKIFDFSSNHDKPNFRAMAIKSLDGDPNNKKDIDKCITDITKKVIKKTAKQMENQLSSMEIRNQMHKLSNPIRAKYNQKYFDCDNLELMHNMLKDSLNLLSKNRKFVLASMPDVDEFPALRLWIYQRYGKRYTFQECLNSFKISSIIFKRMESVPLRLKTPTNSAIGDNLHVHYDMHDYLLKKGQWIRNKYYKKLSKYVLDLSRLHWLAMGPIGANRMDFFRKTYFAYMPDSPGVIHNFRVWKQSEFKDSRDCWERRQNK